MAMIKISVKAKSENPTKTLVEAGKFKMVIDEPKSLGGTDEGANPVEFMLGALSGCLNVVGHMIAGEMGFSLKSLDIALEGDLDTAKLMGTSDDGRAGFKEIRVDVSPVADVSPAVLDEWLKKVEERCPVSDNLANPTPVRIKIKL